MCYIMVIKFITSTFMHYKLFQTMLMVLDTYAVLLSMQQKFELKLKSLTFKWHLSLLVAPKLAGVGPHGAKTNVLPKLKFYKLKR